MPYTKHPWTAVETDWDYVEQSSVVSKDSYRAIFDLMQDQGRVEGHLAFFAQAADTFPGLCSAFRALEAPAGFANDVVTVQTNLETNVFFDTLIWPKKPFVDPGAEAAHGALTHRLQWAMILREFGGDRIVPLLYSGLAVTPARTGRYPFLDHGTFVLWDILVDSSHTPAGDGLDPKDRKSARSPEYLMKYMECHNDPNIKKIWNWSKTVAANAPRAKANAALTGAGLAAINNAVNAPLIL